MIDLYRVSESLTCRVLGYGSATPAPGETLDHTSALLCLAGQPVLIDFPRNVASSLHARGVDPLAVRDIVLTHAHPDHFAGLPSLAHQCQQRRKRPDLLPPDLAAPAPVRIYTPRAHADRPMAVLDAFGLTKRMNLWPIEVIPLPIDAPGDTHTLGLAPGFRAEFIGGDHAGTPVSAVALWDEADAYADQAGPGLAPPALVWSSDTEPCEAILARSAGAGLLIHDCQAAEGRVEGHTTAAQLVAALGGRGGPARLCPVHVPSRAVLGEVVRHLNGGFAQRDQRLTQSPSIVDPNDLGEVGFRVASR